MMTTQCPETYHRDISGLLGGAGLTGSPPPEVAFARFSPGLDTEFSEPCLRHLQGRFWWSRAEARILPQKQPRFLILFWERCREGEEGLLPLRAPSRTLPVHKQLSLGAPKFTSHPWGRLQRMRPRQDISWKMQTLKRCAESTQEEKWKR